jgi:hypothetical protein
MKSSKKIVAPKHSVKFKDLKSKKNPKGGEVVTERITLTNALSKVKWIS